MTDGIAVNQALILLIPVSVTVIALYVWCALALGAVFVKSGEPRWKAWVPFVNLAALLVLGGIPGWWVLLLLLPGLGALIVAVLVIVAAHRVNLSFGYGGGMTVLAALLFPVWATVLGFGSARWIGREGRRRRGAEPDATGFGAPETLVTASPPPPPAPPAVSPFAPPPLDRPAVSDAHVGSLARAEPTPEIRSEPAAENPAEDEWDLLSEFTEAEQSPPPPVPPLPRRRRPRSLLRRGSDPSRHPCPRSRTLTTRRSPRPRETTSRHPRARANRRPCPNRSLRRRVRRARPRPARPGSLRRGADRRCDGCRSRRSRAGVGRQRSLAL
ncbi:hypothetical protein IT882_01890 [Microbacterium schleiferi]|uniref:Uncharacterized protein n=1 Tax=Microbacterium schleiferi TaxID=69362 RepID=A0A7S8MXA7_9MICO|nr:DUF5684 domain-containing protein [Microbacterium schleiferi]QPE04902.1 hypothetical protein IT882_01890 [Microbacterium schleiferi]